MLNKSWRLICTFSVFPPNSTLRDSLFPYWYEIVSYLRYSGNFLSLLTNPPAKGGLSWVKPVIVSLGVIALLIHISLSNFVLFIQIHWPTSTLRVHYPPTKWETIYQEMFQDLSYSIILCFQFFFLNWQYFNLWNKKLTKMSSALYSNKLCVFGSKILNLHHFIYWMEQQINEDGGLVGG